MNARLSPVLLQLERHATGHVPIVSDVASDLTRSFRVCGDDSASFEVCEAGGDRGFWMMR